MIKITLNVLAASLVMSACAQTGDQVADGTNRDEAQIIADYRASVAIPADEPESPELVQCISDFALNPEYQSGTTPEERWDEIDTCMIFGSVPIMIEQNNR